MTDHIEQFSRELMNLTDAPKLEELANALAEHQRKAVLQEIRCINCKHSKRGLPGSRPHLLCFHPGVCCGSIGDTPWISGMCVNFRSEDGVIVSEDFGCVLFEKKEEGS